MANPWFKLYGIEMLSDPKYQRLNAGERSCWITLLCLGSMDDGRVKFCEEQYLITHSGIDVMDISKYHGILVKFEVLGLISKGRDDIGIEYIIIKNWGKRQEVYSESTERVRRWRDKQKELGSGVVTDVTLQGNARIEEKRVDKKRVDATTSTEKYFFTLPEEQLPINSFLSPEETRKFHRYWSETNKRGKMRWELQKTFELGRRMATWRDRAAGNVSSFARVPQKVDRV